MWTFIEAVVSQCVSEIHTLTTLRGICSCAACTDKTRGAKMALRGSHSSVFSLNISFLFDNGKPVAASSEWDLHSQKEFNLYKSYIINIASSVGFLKQKEYPFWECMTYDLYAHNNKLLIYFLECTIPFLRVQMRVSRTECITIFFPVIDLSRISLLKSKVRCY